MNGFERVAGSDRAPMDGSSLLGPVDPEEPVTISVLVRRGVDTRPFDATAHAASPPDSRRRWTRETFAAVRGADRNDLDRIERFAASSGLTVTGSDAARRMVKLRGCARDACAAFDVELNRYHHPRAAFRGRTGFVSVPGELAPLVEGVFGLDDRPQAVPQFRIADPAQVTASYTPNQVAALYSFPTGASGDGECVALIELGGGYRQADLDGYFARLGLTAPTVVAVPVGGATNAPTGDPGGPDGEVMLDIEIVGAIAPAARIAVYFAPNTDQGFIDAVTTATHDQVNRPSVISISWGGPESSWTSQAQHALDQAFNDAAALGITVCAAAGDNGAGDGVDDGRAHVDFPASSPHALACGGTHLRQAGPEEIDETVWNSRGGATGGGISDTFDLPSWQAGAGVPPSVNPNHRVGRGVPDVAADADPTTGYTIQVDGGQKTIGGTSAAAPLWAALTALLNQELGHPVGYLNPTLYTLSPDVRTLNDITGGNNTIGDTPGYSAGPGWDACTGLGTPIGESLLRSLTPRTP